MQMNPKYSSIVALSFDAAGTLIRPVEKVGSVYARIAARHHLACDAGMLQAAFLAAFTEIRPPAPELYRADDGRTYWRAIVDRTFEQAGRVTVTDPLFESLYSHYANPAAWSLLPGVRETLALLVPAYRLAVLSNFDSRLIRILNGLGIGDSFGALLYSTAIGYDKPAPQAFHAVSETLGVRPQQILHIGDDPQRDWAGAIASGMQVYRLSPAHPLSALPSFLLSRG